MSDLTYTLKQKFHALPPFECSGTLEEIKEILTAGAAEIIYLDDAAVTGSDSAWLNPPEKYNGLGWYYSHHENHDLTKADSLEDAIQKVGSHDTSSFSLNKDPVYILHIERDCGTHNRGYTFGKYEDHNLREGYEEIESGTIHIYHDEDENPVNQDDQEKLDHLTNIADIIYEVDNISACNNSHRIK